MPPTASRQTAGPARAPARQGVLSRIRPIQFDDDEGIKLLLYGRSGTGKTTLWGSFPGKVLAVVCSGGMRPGELRSLDTPELRRSVDTVTLQHSSELLELVRHVGSTAEYRTMVLDHCSGLQDRVLAELLSMDEVPAQKGWGLATQQQYGQVTAQCKELLRRMLGLRQNVVVVAHERTFGGSEDGSPTIQPTVGPGVMPTLAGWLGGAVDYIGETFIRQYEEVETVTVGSGKNAKTMETRRRVPGRVEYCLRTAPDPVYMTKFRQPKGRPLPDVIVDPDYAKVYDLIREGRKADGDRTRAAR